MGQWHFRYSSHRRLYARLITTHWIIHLRTECPFTTITRKITRIHLILHRDLQENGQKSKHNQFIRRMYRRILRRSSVMDSNLSTSMNITPVNKTINTFFMENMGQVNTKQGINTKYVSLLCCRPLNYHKYCVNNPLRNMAKSAYKRNQKLLPSTSQRICTIGGRQQTSKKYVQNHN